MFRIAMVSLASLCALSQFVHAQTSPDLVGELTTPPAIHQMREVSRSLSLDDKQMIRLNELLGNLQGTYRNYYSDVKKLPEPERVSRLDELDRKYADEWMAGSRKILNESQMTRMQQLHWQYAGFSSFNYPEIQKQLNLTDEQKKALGSNRMWSNQQLSEINRIGAKDAERGDKLYREYWKSFETKVEKILTADQLRTWRNITGQHFEFPRTATSSR